MNFTATLIELGRIGFVLPVSECDLKLTTEDKGMLSGVGYAGNKYADFPLIFNTLIIRFNFIYYVSLFHHSFGHIWPTHEVVKR